MNQGLQLRLPLLQATWQATAKMPRRLRAVAQGGDERPAAARRRARGRAAGRQRARQLLR